MPVQLENMTRTCRIKMNMLQQKPQDVKIDRRVQLLMQGVLDVHTHRRRRAKLVSICLADRA
jgi:hypothetical protein